MDLRIWGLLLASEAVKIGLEALSDLVLSKELGRRPLAPAMRSKCANDSARY